MNLKKDQKDKQNAHQSISVLVGPPHHLFNLLQGVVNCWLLVKQNSFIFFTEQFVVNCQLLVKLNSFFFYWMVLFLRTSKRSVARSCQLFGFPTLLLVVSQSLILFRSIVLFLITSKESMYILREVVFNGCQSNFLLPTAFLEGTNQTGGYLPL